MTARRDLLANLLREAQARANRAGRALHDDVGPLLSGAGLHLQLLRMDHPEVASKLDEIEGILHQAFERIRGLSQELAPSPVMRVGLKAALQRFAETSAEDLGVAARLDYRITAQIPVEAACALYAATHAAASAASADGAARIAIAARGSRLVSIRVADDGRPRGRVKALATARRMAEASGLAMTIATKHDTIVSIRYALRRPAGG